MALLTPNSKPLAYRRHFLPAAWGGAFAGLLLFFTSTSGLWAQEIQAPEAEVKAAFLYNFTKLVTWPTNAFASSNAPLVIGVLGKDPFGKYLDAVLAGRSSGGRRIQAAYFKQVESVTNCHVLFISDSERRKLDFVIGGLRDQPTLTVGDSKGFAEFGMIELVKTNNKINLSINLEAASRAGLVLSSHLTRLDRNLRPLLSGSTNTPAKAPPALR